MCICQAGPPWTTTVAQTFAGTPAGSLPRTHSNRQPLLHVCRVPSIIIGGLTGKEKKDNSIRIPFSSSTASTIGRGWLRGCKAAPSYYCAWLSLSRTRRRQYSTPRAWGMNSKYEALDFFFNLVSFPLICVLYPSPLCCLSFSKLMPITPPPTGSSRLLGHCGVLIAETDNARHYPATVRVNLVAQGCSDTFPSAFSLLWGPTATLGVPPS